MSLQHVLHRVLGVAFVLHPGRARALRVSPGRRVSNVHLGTMDHRACLARLAVLHVMTEFPDPVVAFLRRLRILHRVATVSMASVARMGNAVVFQVGRQHPTVPSVLLVQLDTSSIHRVTVKFANSVVPSVLMARAIVSRANLATRRMQTIVRSVMLLPRRPLAGQLALMAATATAQVASRALRSVKRVPDQPRIIV